MKNIIKLSAMPYAQAKVVKCSEGGFVLVSYATQVAYIDPEGWLRIFGLYSATTRRHIGAFVKEYARVSYQTAKMLYEKGQVYNIYTGEVAGA